MSQLYPYQEVGVDWLAGRFRGLLADRMGLGKTVQAIIAARAVNALHSLVVAPASTIPNWEAEWKAWGGPPNVRFVSYSKLIREDTQGYAPDVMILDEAHYCKNPTAKRTRIALSIAARANYAWLLTGTPMPNDPTELYAFFRYLWPERLKDLGIRTADEWMHRFCLTWYTEYGPKPYAVRNGTLLRTQLDDIMLRRSLADVGFDLPPLRIDIQRFPAEHLDTDIYGEVDEEDYTSRVRRILGTAKASFVADTIVREMQDGEYSHIVVLYHHRDVGNLLRARFNVMQLRTTGFDGSTPTADRAAAIEEFQAGKADVFLAQQTAAGVGITLHVAHEIVLMEPAWSPSDNLQAITRIHRIGQDKPCRARIFAASGTLDEAVMSTLRTKLQMQADLGLEGVI